MSEKLIYCFDIDSTILYSECDERGNYTLVGENTDLIKKINELHDSDNTIIIQTGRHWNHLRITIDQLKNAGVKYHTLEMGKPFAHFYIDDKGITPEDFLERFKN
jgi:hydroxymethylpyrimidine pyrophosphatase-like HAD family hydrolase